MSIIYEALKKTQQKMAADKEELQSEIAPQTETEQRHDAVQAAIRVKKYRQTFAKKIKWIYFFNFLLCLSLLLLALALFPPFLKWAATLKPVHKPVVPAKPIVATRIDKQPVFNLTGIFISNKEQIAIINTHILHEGDSINHYKVINIKPNAVKLQNGTQTLTLSTLM